MDGVSLSQIALTGVDLAVIGGYFLLVALIGVLVARRTHDDQDLFLAGRRLHWAPVGLSLFASNISSTTLIGLAGAAYSWGLAVANYEWMAAPILVVMALVFIPLYLNARVGTVPEWLEHRFDRRARQYFSALTLISNILVDTAGTLFAGALVLASLVPGLDLFSAALLLAAVAASYTAAGGLAAVVYTDVLQAILLIIGACLVTWLSFAELGFDWNALVAATPPERLHLFLPLNDPNLPWLGTLIGVPVLGFYFWCTNQFIVQRVLGARSIGHARAGALLAGLLKLPVLFIMVLPGVMAIQILPGLEHGDQVFPALIAELLPVGLTGLILAALVAALMSSIDSTLNAAATLLTLDFIKPAWPGLSPTRTAWIGRLAVVLFMLLAAAIAPLIGHFEGLFHYLQTALSYLVPPVAAVFVLGAFVSHAGPRSALATLLGGHLISAVLFVLWLLDILALHFTLVAGVLFALSAGIFLITRWRWPLEATQAGSAGWSPHLSRPEAGTSLWQDYRVHAVLLLMLTVALVWSFR
ncbi:sodium:solute symporter family transporter [Rhabdochromatium marinum]|uniref:sodium:solute symporter family transporter n=1 Tax=Rhabdochromatium marinum TaxID=48729 RepID=UPI0019056200|nr:sodium/solute symporter [Rhabdochromatium marinum]MBK1647385.1 sodium/glucose cotransporter 2 [Rhabdochromatium marinum]